MTDVSAGQSLTGERTLPGIWFENYWFRRHEVVYQLLDALAPHGGAALDAGCGEGYGSWLLGRSRHVVGLDYDAQTLCHLRSRYPTVPAVRANLVALPVRDRALTTVVSLQVVEHVWEQSRYLAECVRVLAPGGRLAVSTPNRLTFSPGVGRGEKPLNPFHVNELDAEELADLVTAAGAEVLTVLGLRHGPRITRWERRHGKLVAAQLAQPYDRWPTRLARLVRSVTVEDFLASGRDLDTSLDLVLLARRPEGGQ